MRRQGKNTSLLSAIPDHSHIHFMPSHICKLHCLKLVNVIDFRGSDICLVMVNGSLNVFCMVMSFEASDDALIHWLDMSSEIQLKILDMNVPKTVWDNVIREIIL